MELKLEISLKTNHGENRLNRTFMELKLSNALRTRRDLRVLIEPLWN